MCRVSCQIAKKLETSRRSQIMARVMASAKGREAGDKGTGSRDQGTGLGSDPPDIPTTQN